MKSQVVILDTVQICDECGIKIKKGKSAITLPNSGAYFCSNRCAIKKAEETE